MVILILTVHQEYLIIIQLYVFLLKDTEKILIESRNKKITDILNYNFTTKTSF